MKYIIDMIDDIRENIQNSYDYTLLAMLLKEDSLENFQNVGVKVITSLYVDHDAKQLQLGFFDENVTSKELLECVNSLEMKAMMYEVMIKVSNEHPLMPIIGFGDNHKEKQYTFFVIS
ncbi:hypothetical protein HUE87_04840 [Candidatus Sulfurimonas marisnigri]|uniref:Uncharacterized protein n=1 Tax=Candidatus Sulfurimonas marisnigri TaxID=2740405 RepID=A0A7S7RRD5_9BACT|nr:hypothetical protein [Candidatus Sulfurimonas marisnigri]QOY55558.1 hypothetical protein HUE87_04840 [Candidatus Sulfurimonas marisnigri]